MNPLGASTCPRPPRAKNRGPRAPEAADRPTRPSRPGRGRRAARGPSPWRDRGVTGPASGRARAPRPWGPPTDNARGRASPGAHRVRSRPRRRQRFSHHLRHRPRRRRRRRARRGHANEPTVPAALRRAGAGPPRALVRKRWWPLPRPLVQARYLILQGGGSEGEKLPCRGRCKREQPGKSGRDTAAAYLFAFWALLALAVTLGQSGRGALSWGRPRRGGPSEPARLRRPEGARGGAASDRHVQHLSHVAAKTG